MSPGFARSGILYSFSHKPPSATATAACQLLAFCRGNRETKMPAKRVFRFLAASRVMALLAGIAMALFPQAVAAQAIAADIPIEGGSERVLFAAPSNPRAIVI